MAAAGKRYEAVAHYRQCLRQRLPGGAGKAGRGVAVLRQAIRLVPSICVRRSPYLGLTPASVQKNQIPYTRASMAATRRATRAERCSNPAASGRQMFPRMVTTTAASLFL